MVPVVFVSTLSYLVLLKIAMLKSCHHMLYLVVQGWNYKLS